LKQAFIITDKEYAKKKNPSDGTTAIVATIDSKNVVTVANAGDSRCILHWNGQIFELSVDHKPDLPSERERIEKAGHVVTKQTFVEDGVRKTLYRVNNFLAVARSIGDFSGKEEQGGPEVQPITCVPEIKKKKMHALKGDILIMACDGLWDVMTSKDVGKFVDEHKSATPKELCELLIKNSMKLKTSDNVTVIVVKI